MGHYSPAHLNLRKVSEDTDMGWLRLVGFLKSKVSSAKEPYKRDDILQKRPIIIRSLLIVATPCTKKIYKKKHLYYHAYMRYVTFLEKDTHITKKRPIKET